LLGAWLIATGLLPLLHLDFSNRDMVMALLAIVAGIAVLLDR
jgi:hypothetical protein